MRSWSEYRPSVSDSLPPHGPARHLCGRALRRLRAGFGYRWPRLLLFGADFPLGPLERRLSGFGAGFDPTGLPLGVPEGPFEAPDDPLGPPGDAGPGAPLDGGLPAPARSRVITVFDVCGRVRVFVTVVAWTRTLLRCRNRTRALCARCTETRLLRPAAMLYPARPSGRHPRAHREATARGPALAAVALGRFAAPHSPSTSVAWQPRGVAAAQSSLLGAPVALE